MICLLDKCEFYNIIFGGIVIGIIASFLFVWLTQLLETMRFKRNYAHYKVSQAMSLTGLHIQWILLGRKRNSNYEIIWFTYQSPIYK
jgi:hypothetical protein